MITMKPGNHAEGTDTFVLEKVIYMCINKMYMTSSKILLLKIFV